MGEKQFWTAAFLSAISGAAIIVDNEGLAPRSLVEDAAGIAEEAVKEANKRGIFNKKTALKTALKTKGEA